MTTPFCLPRRDGRASTGSPASAARWAARLCVPIALLMAGCAVDAAVLDGGSPDHAMVTAVGDLAVSAGDLGAASCADGEKDGDESDVDCGGGCLILCAAGMACRRDADCEGGLCIQATCRQAATCDDGRQDGTESDVDCGGKGCPRCPVAHRCLGRADCLSGVCSGGMCASCTLDFAPKVEFSTALAPSAVAVGDLDGDGRLDLAVPAWGLDLLGTKVSVLIQRVGGTFAPAVDYTVGTRPAAAAIADVDGDGNRDLVVANGRDHTVSVLRNRGGGALADRQDYATGPSPYSLAVVDLDGDRRLDLVTGDLTGDALSVFLGRGDGTFRVSATYPTGARPRGIAVGDVDGDGAPDLVSANQGSVSVLLNRGSGLFSAKKDYAASPQSSVALGDVDGDGRLDAVVDVGGRVNNQGVVGLLRNQGKGAFGAQTGVPIPDFSLAVAIADLDGDGAPEIIASGGDHSVYVLPNRGAGAFGPSRTFPVGSGPVALAVADLDGDGLLDLVTANQTDSTVSLLMNRCH